MKNTKKVKQSEGTLQKTVAIGNSSLKGYQNKA